MNKKTNLLENDLNSLQPNQLSMHFDFDKDFELREIFDANSEIEHNEQIEQIGNGQENYETFINSKSAELEKMIYSLPYINDNIRSNISLSIEIYKKLNNFDYNYIHEIINEFSNSK